MASSPVSICNSALIKVGADRITSLTEDTQRARLVNEQYHKCRKELLRSHPWNFAQKRAELAALSQEPEYEYDYQFQLPSDCLRVLKTDLYSDEPFKIEGRLILCNSDIIKILYIKDETDTSKFDASFDEALALRIASDIAYTLSGSASLAGGLMEAYKSALKDARCFDAQEGSADRLIADEWLVTRY